MRDWERLGRSGAFYLKPHVDLAIRKLHDGNVTEVFHVLSKLDNDCMFALRPQLAPKDTKQMELNFGKDISPR